MSRLENLRQWWREHPENTDNWDIERWRIEHPGFLRLGYAYMIVLALLQIITSFSYSHGSLTIFFAMMVFFGLMFFLGDIHYIRTIRKLEEGSK